MRGRLQRIADFDEPAFIDIEPGIARPGRRASGGHPQYFVGFRRRSGSRRQFSGRHLRDRFAEMQHHVPLFQDTEKRAPYPGIVRRQNFSGVAEQVEFDVVGRLARAGAQLTEAVLDRQQDFDPAGAGADDGDAHRPFMGHRAGAERIPAVEEIVDRLDRHHVPGRARHQRGVRRRARIDGCQFERHRRAVVAENLLFAQIQPGHGRMIEPGIGKPRQRAEIDMRFIVAVVPGNVARQHSRIRRVRIAANQGQPHPGQRVHAEPLEHGDMAVAAANQHQVLDDGRIGFFHNVIAVPVWSEDAAASARRGKKHRRRYSASP